MHGLGRLTENVCAGFLVTSRDCSKGKFSAGLLLSLCVCTEQAPELSLQMQVQDLAEMVLPFQPLCICTRKHSLASNSSAGSHCPRWWLHTLTLAHMLEIFKVQMKYTHKRSQPWKTQTTARSTQAERPALS